MQPIIDVAVLHPVAQVALVLAPPSVILIKAWMAHRRAVLRRLSRADRRLGSDPRRRGDHSR